MNYVFYDFETSGRSSSWDQIIEVGAVLVNDNDSEAMTNAIVDLIKNEKKTVLMSENARAFVEQMDWDNIKKKWRVLLS